jgi:flagellar basal body-associated protein FliL
MNRHFDRLFILLVVFLVAILLGYALRMYHEAKNTESYQSQAEKDLAALEEEFYSASENPHTFYIFNGQYKVYPVKDSKRRFHYRQFED